MISGISSSYASAYFQPGKPCTDGSCDETEEKLALQEEASKSDQTSESASGSEKAEQQNSEKTGTDGEASADEKSADKSKSASNEQQLTEKELQEVQQLKQRDQEVRTHEAAHLAAAGQYARGGASYSYQTGPDGKRYAVGGEVSIDTSPIPGDPDATLQKANTIRAAATAPAEPSSQDRQVAAEAAQMAAEARQQIAEQQIQSSKDNHPASQSETDNNREESGSAASKQAREYQAIASMDVSPQSSMKINYSA